MNDITKMKKAELLTLIRKQDAEVFTIATNDKWKVAQLREWLTDCSSDDPEPEDEDKDEKTLSETMSKYRKGYTKAKAYNGMATVNNGDDLASLLLPLDPQETVALAERVLDLADDELWDRYAHLNNGQKRMNAGNKLRFALKKETISLADVKKAIK